MIEIICSGFGGQGVLTAGLILADAGMENGSTANCNVKISEEEIASPYCGKGSLDILLALNRAAADKFEANLRPGGLLLINSSLVPANRRCREDVRVIRVPANEIAAEEKNAHGVNLVMLGAMAAAYDGFDAEQLCRDVNHYFYKKKKKEFPKNEACFRRGMQFGAKSEEEAPMTREPWARNTFRSGNTCRRGRKW